MGYILKRTIDAGVPVFFSLEDREAVIRGPAQKMLLQLAAFASEMERHQGRQRTRDAMHRKASRDHVAGGKVCGYHNIRRMTTSSVRLSHRKRPSSSGSSRRSQRAGASPASPRG